MRIKNSPDVITSDGSPPGQRLPDCTCARGNMGLDGATQQLPRGCVKKMGRTSLGRRCQGGRAGFLVYSWCRRGIQGVRGASECVRCPLPHPAGRFHNWRASALRTVSSLEHRTSPKWAGSGANAHLPLQACPKAEYKAAAPNLSATMPRGPWACRVLRAARAAVSVWWNALFANAATKVFLRLTAVSEAVVQVESTDTLTPQNLRPGVCVFRSPLRAGDTWLILPVVICLSQRLSHACLSLSFIWPPTTPPTKNGHAPPPIESRKSCQSVIPYYVWTW